MSNRIIILGTKGIAKKALEIIEEQNNYTEIAFLDSYSNESFFKGYQVLGKCDDLEKFTNIFNYAFICINDIITRMQYFQRLVSVGYKIPNIIHSLAHISKTADLGVGLLVNALASVQSDTVVGNGCFIDTGAVVEHDNAIGEFVNISPNATTTGNVTIRSKAFIGAGSTIINSINVGENAIVAAGSTVITDIPDNVMVAGCPAKIKKELSACSLT